MAPWPHQEEANDLTIVWKYHYIFRCIYIYIHLCSSTITPASITDSTRERRDILVSEKGWFSTVCSQTWCCHNAETVMYGKWRSAGAWGTWVAQSDATLILHESSPNVFTNYWQPHTLIRSTVNTIRPRCARMSISRRKRIHKAIDPIKTHVYFSTSLKMH